MQEIKCTCDKCKTAVIVDSFHASGYKKVEIKLSQYNYKSFDLCPDCQSTYGLTVQDKGKTIEPPVANVQDRLFDLIAEIVADVTNN